MELVFRKRHKGELICRAGMGVYEIAYHPDGLKKSTLKIEPCTSYRKVVHIIDEISGPYHHVMALTEIMAVAVLSIFLTSIFVFGFRTKGPWGNRWSFFLVVIIALSADSIWAPPAGPVWYGVAWIDLLTTGLFVCIILSAMTPSIERRPAQKRIRVERRVLNWAWTIRFSPVANSRTVVSQIYLPPSVFASKTISSS